MAKIFISYDKKITQNYNSEGISLGLEVDVPGPEQITQAYEFYFQLLKTNANKLLKKRFDTFEEEEL